MCSDNKIKITSRSAAETARIGELLGGAAYPGLAILLYGDLGMGKTVLAQGVGRALSTGRIKSPTFIIVAEHGGKIPMAHVDLYRVESARETDALDLEQYTDDDGVLVVEWAERWASAPEEDVWKISFSKREPDGARDLTIEACGTRAQKILFDVMKKFDATCGETI